MVPTNPYSSDMSQCNLFNFQQIKETMTVEWFATAQGTKQKSLNKLKAAFYKCFQDPKKVGINVFYLMGIVLKKALKM